jgi:phosphoglycolate phosphatase
MAQFVNQARTAFVFDLDGTLFDSVDQIISAANSTRIEFGYESREKVFYIPFIGLPARNLFIDLNLLESEEKNFVLKFREYLSKLIKTDNKLFNGAIEFLQRSKDSNIFVGIATTKPSALAQLVVENSKISGLVDHVQGTDNFKAKPDPTVILRCLEELKTDKAIMFGDRIEDMIAGKTAGIKSIGISQGFHSHEKLHTSGADLVVDNFVTLLDKWDHVTSLLDQK